MGGTLTNWGTVSKSIKTLNTLESRLADPEVTISKKERLQAQRKIEKLNQALGGIRQMGGKPDLIFVIDTNREDIAILEAKKLGIPVVAIVDTNCDPDGIDYIIPGNDDSIKSIRLYCNLFADAVLSGMSKSLGSRAEREKVAAENEESNEKRSAKKASIKKDAEKAKKSDDAKVVDMVVEDKDAEIDAEAKAAKSKKKAAPAADKKKSAKK
jgi:small subunit ribosomal protein S2